MCVYSLRYILNSCCDWVLGRLRSVVGQVRGKGGREKVEGVGIK